MPEDKTDTNASFKKSQWTGESPDVLILTGQD